MCMHFFYTQSFLLLLRLIAVSKRQENLRTDIFYKKLELVAESAIDHKQNFVGGVIRYHRQDRPQFILVCCRQLT